MIKAASIAAVAIGVLAVLALASSGSLATAGPVNTDGDGCPDAIEMTTPYDYLNPWDFFDPDHDGENRVADIALVAQDYGLDDGDLGYTTNTDRSFVGPAYTNLGPPDDRIRSDDILAIVQQYFIDCI